MSFTMFVTWVRVGVLAGVLAGLAMKRGGYGLKKDIIFGLVGAIGLSWIFRAVGLFPQAGIVAMAFVAAVGAVIPIVAQRKFWPTEGAGEEKADKWWRWGLGAAGGGGGVWVTLRPVPPPGATARGVGERADAATPPAGKGQ